MGLKRKGRSFGGGRKGFYCVGIFSRDWAVGQYRVFEFELLFSFLVGREEFQSINLFHPYNNMQWLSREIKSWSTYRFLGCETSLAW
jgi:hypothetical protein